MAITRREFIKRSAIIGGLAGVSGAFIGTAMSSTLVVADELPATGVEKWVYTACDLCDQYCGLKIKVVDGVVVKVEGIEDHPLNHGRICSRPNSYMVYQYNPWRVQKPMKRTNPQKGIGIDPKWVEITWDEAFNTIAEKLKAVKAKDPHRLWMHNGHRSQGNFWSDFANVFGTTTRLGSVNFCTGGANHMSSVYFQGSGGCHPYLDYTKYFIEIGGRLYGAKGGPEVIRYATSLRENGMKCLNLCPMISPNNPNPDEWIPIKVGTDAAFILSMMYVMFYELGEDYPGYDVEFLKARSNGPFLIKPDGMYMRAEASDDPLFLDETRLEREFGKPLVWDPIDNVPKVYDDPTIKEYTLNGSYSVTWKDMPTVECRTAFQCLKDNVGKYKPEDAEKICTIPAATIRRIAKDFVDNAQIGSTIVIEGEEMRFRPSAFSYSKSYSGSRGWHTQSALKMINTLIGSINCPGGWGAQDVDLTLNEADGCNTIHDFMYTHIKFPPEYPGLNFDSRTGGGGMYPMCYNLNTLAWFAMENPEKYWLQHPCEVYWVNNANLFGNSFSPEFTAEQMKKIDFMIAMPYHFDEIADMCDIILPQASHLEGALTQMNIDPYCRTEPPGIEGYYLHQPSVEPLYDTKNVDEILMELSDRLGLLEDWNTRMNRRYLGRYPLEVGRRYTIEEIMDRKLKNDCGEAHGLEYFKQNGGYFTEENGPMGLYHDTEFPDSRYRIYTEDLVWARNEWKLDLDKLKAEHGATLRPSNDFVLNMMQPVPDWLERPYEQCPAEFDMYAVHYKTMQHSMATFMDNAWFAEYVALFDPYSMKIMIHPEAAKARGIKNGDVITAESVHGKDSTECVITELVRPDTIAIGGCMGSRSANIYPPSREGALFNRLCWADEEWRDPVTGNQENSMKVKVYKGAVNKGVEAV